MRRARLLGRKTAVLIDKAIKCESWGQRDEAAELYESAADVLNTLAETAPRKQRKEIGRGGCALGAPRPSSSDTAKSGMQLHRIRCFAGTWRYRNAEDEYH